jgi:hypothetical protein
MRGAPAGAVVRLTYDADEPVEEGHGLRTQSGRLYFVIEARHVRSGLHPQRYALRAVVQVELPPGTRVHPLRWYSRGLGASGRRPL